MYEIRHYVTRDGRDLFETLVQRIRDMRALAAIDRRLARAESGNFGDHKFCQDGVWELRIDVGAGYRVYYAIEDVMIVLLING